MFSVVFTGLISIPLIAAPAWIGNIVSNSVPANFGTYWNQVTPENATKWGSVENNRGNMNWGSTDTIFNYAKSKGIPFKFHTLVWGSQEPSWIGGLSQADQLTEITEWMQAAAAKYSGSQFVDVVNEPLHAKPSYRNALGGDGSTGWDWVIKAFQMARQYFPNSKLLINDYGIIGDTNATNQYLTIINLLKSRNLVDGIGIQCHYFNMDNVSTGTMTSVLNSLKATGLPIYVSELDISGDDTTQANRYKEKFMLLYNNSAGITIWGYIQGQTWATNTHLASSGNVGATERPALQWLKQYLNPTGTVGPTITPTITVPMTSAPTPTPLQNPIWSGGPYTFNGTSDYADMTAGLTKNLGDISIACWVKLNTISTWSRIFDFGNDNNVYMMLTPATSTTGYPYFCITTSGNSGEQGINGTSALPTGSWQHLAVVKSGNIGILYINKQEVGRNTSMTLKPSDLGNLVNNYIGKSQWSADPYLNGSVDKFMVYNRAISAAEVVTLGSNPPGGSVSLGDVNGSGAVDVVDALITAQYSVGLNPAGFVAANADVNCDGSITIVDALIIAQYYVGLVAQFCK